MPENEDYEFLPHKEIEDLRRELESLKEMDITPTKKLHISIIELNRNIEKLLTIFEEAIREINIEEGGLMFSEKIKPVVNRLDRLERNMESVADVLSNLIAPTLSEIHDKIAPGGDRSTDSVPETDLDDVLPPPPPL